jgi:hypothetical protein
MSAATYFIGFMTFIVVSLFVSKTLLLLRSHGMSEGVFLLLYAHLGLFQFFILLAILWLDRARIPGKGTACAAPSPQTRT